MSKRSKKKKASVYLDNNATTETCKPSYEASLKWMKDAVNPSADSKQGIEARKMLEHGCKYICKHCSAPNYTVIYTSGASESNSLIIRSTVESYIKYKKVKPHLITSLTEHKSILETCNVLRQVGMLDVTYVAPGINGCVPPSLVQRAIKPNTCLITIMAANNELGCINSLKEIGAIAHASKIPFHSDFVQLFGKFKYNLPAHNIDAISVSFHKLYGPTGCGLLVVNNDFIDGYRLESQIAGTQQGGLRGGTQNVPAIAGSLAAMKHTFLRRKEKNKRLYSLRKFIMDELGKKFVIGDYRKYAGQEEKIDQVEPLEVVFLGQLNQSRALPNTLLISTAKNQGKPFCNVKLKKALDKSGIVVSIGSACNTASAKASHVLDAIRAPPVIKRGVIRVSLCDTTTKKDVQSFISIFTSAVMAQK
jgi:cysteine desulfurase